MKPNEDKDKDESSPQVGDALCGLEAVHLKVYVQRRLVVLSRVKDEGWQPVVGLQKVHVDEGEKDRHNELGETGYAHGDVREDHQEG